MRLFRRRPLITEENYGRLMTSFGRTVDADPLVAGPAEALADRVTAELASEAAAADEKLYSGAAVYHLRLLAGAWILASEGGIPTETAEVFEEAVAWRFGTRELPERLGKLARGEVERDLSM
ncbi:MAG: hypothetical protein F4Y54_07810 [Dehalococcoidia bacterium]|nr:hypothetical protein [Dehalococcoidia bacterium]